jgi:multiple sugar transport system substrate-binding protein
MHNKPGKVLHVPPRSVARPFGPSLTRRDLLRHAAVLGAVVSGGSLLAACERGEPEVVGPADRPITPTYYDWILSLYPPIEAISQDFAESVRVTQAPVEGFGIERFVAEAREQESTWDIYVGQTPFVEMAALVEAGVIEPWDEWVSDEIVDDMTPAVRDEGTYQGSLYQMPFLVDVITSGWNGELVEQADLDPDDPPQTWDEIIDRARQVVDSDASPFGITFDGNGWRSLAPIAHSIDMDVYDEDGLFDFTNDAVVEALEIMRRMRELANPDVLDPGAADGGVNDTPDEGVFAARQVAYYVKYANAPVRFANAWPDRDHLRLAGLPSVPGGAGGTVFWTTGAALFTHGTNKETAADYLYHVTRDERVWQQSMGDVEERVGQLPPYESTWDEWEADRPDWLVEWAEFLREQVAGARAIATHEIGVQQFFVGRPHWEEYLTGAESDPRAALQRARAAVLEEVELA